MVSQELQEGGPQTWPQSTRHVAEALAPAVPLAANLTSGAQSLDLRQNTDSRSECTRLLLRATPLSQHYLRRKPPDPAGPPFGERRVAYLSGGKDAVLRPSFRQTSSRLREHRGLFEMVMEAPGKCKQLTS